MSDKQFDSFEKTIKDLDKYELQLGNTVPLKQSQITKKIPKSPKKT